ncbi:MAG: LysR family transcriptional regulator [Parvibaculaceae bacterium]|nr:LysR family transcriptional regulator [Parvibaculaceae bacterium]
MNLSDASWDLIAAYLAVVRSGSLSAAARQLGASQPTVRRHIEALEVQLGVSLFTRGPSGLTPTVMGQSLLSHAEAMEAAAAAFARTATGELDAAGGVVRVTCSDVYSVEVLPAIFVELRNSYPKLEIELVPSNKNKDLLRRGADVAVRFARPEQAALIAKKVKIVKVGLYASREFLTTSPAPSTYEELVENCHFIGGDRSDVMVKAFEALGRPLPKHIVYRTDSDLAQLAAIRAGVGIGVCQLKIGETSGLVRVLPTLYWDMPSWVVMHEDLKKVKRVRLLFDHLVAALS